MDTENILRPPQATDDDRIECLAAFKSSEYERAFREQHFRDDLWLSGLLVGAGMLRVALLLAADYHHFAAGPTFWMLLASRLFFLVVSGCVLVALRRATSAAGANRLFYGWGFLIIFMTVFAVSVRPPSNNGLVLMSFGVIIVTYCVAPLPLGRQMTLALAYSAAILYVSRHAEELTLSTVAATHAMAHVFGAVTSWRLNCRRRQMFLAALREAQLRADLEAAVAEVKTLRGMLCICAWCKRIRDEAETWEPVEEYVQTRTHASFSHGICPDCVQDFDEACAHQSDTSTDSNSSFQHDVRRPGAGATAYQLPAAISLPPAPAPVQ